MSMRCVLPSTARFEANPRRTIEKPDTLGSSKDELLLIDTTVDLLLFSCRDSMSVAMCEGFAVNGCQSKYRQSVRLV